MVRLRRESTSSDYSQYSFRFRVPPSSLQDDQDEIVLCESPAILLCAPELMTNLREKNRLASSSQQPCSKLQVSLFEAFLLNIQQVQVSRLIYTSHRRELLPASLSLVSSKAHNFVCALVHRCSVFLVLGPAFVAGAAYATFRRLVAQVGTQYSMFSEQVARIFFYLDLAVSTATPTVVI